MSGREWIGTKTLYHSDLHSLEELHRGGTWQGTGLETHAWEVALWAKKDPRRSVAHERPTPDRAEVGSMDQQRKTAVHWPQRHVSPVTSLKGRGRDCMQHAVRIREVGTGKGGREVLDWSWGWGRKGISVSFLSLDILFFSSVAKLVIKICVKWVWIKLNEICWVKTVLPATRGLNLFSIFTQLWAAFFASHQNVLIEKYFFFRTGMFSTQHVVSMEGGYGAMTRCSYSWPLPVLRTSFLFLHRGGDLLGDKWQKQLFSSQFLKTEHERRLLLL